MDPFVKKLRHEQATRMVDAVEDVAQALDLDPMDPVALSVLQTTLQRAVVEVTMMRAVLLATGAADEVARA